MRAHLLLLANALACGVAPGPTDAGRDAGQGQDAGPVCTPTTVHPCVALSAYAAYCATTSEAHWARVCPSDVRREVCPDGTIWSLLPGVTSAITCVYASDGGLIGASTESDTGRTVRAGQWALDGCRRAVDACEDAGACEPPEPGSTCAPLEYFRGTCDATPETQRQRICSTDASAWTRSTCADGGTEWVEALGFRTSCAYVDGALVGATRVNDLGARFVAGRWLLRDCVEVPTCP